MPKIVIAIDPGRMKCGVAVVKRSSLKHLSSPTCSCREHSHSSFETLHADVVDTASLANAIHELVERYEPQVIVIGNGTTSSQAVRAMECLGLSIPVETVDEKFTTLLARKRFFQENPPTGIRRLIPVSMQTPTRPYDDYVAVILAETFLSHT